MGETKEPVRSAGSVTCHTLAGMLDRIQETVVPKTPGRVWNSGLEVEPSTSVAPEPAFNCSEEGSVVARKPALGA